MWQAYSNDASANSTTTEICFYCSTACFKLNGLLATCSYKLVKSTTCCKSANQQVVLLVFTHETSFHVFQSRGKKKFAQE